jgi:hypothetical protein
MSDGEATGRPASFWEDVGNDYAGNELTILQICAKHDLTRGQFSYARLQFGWKRRYLTEVSRDKLIKRLFRLLDRTLEIIEDNMTTVTETEVNVLGKLVQSMGKLIEIETATNTAATPRQTKDMHDIRRKLVARIEELKRS